MHSNVQLPENTPLPPPPPPFSHRDGSATVLIPLLLRKHLSLQTRYFRRFQIYFTFWASLNDRYYGFFYILILLSGRYFSTTYAVHRYQSYTIIVSTIQQIGELKTEPQPPVRQLSVLWSTCNPRRKLVQQVSVKSIHDKELKDIVQSIKSKISYKFFHLSSQPNVPQVFTIFICLTTVRQESTTIKLLTTTD